MFAINFGEIGFLATVDREEAGTASRARSPATSRFCALPGIALDGLAGAIGGSGS